MSPRTTSLAPLYSNDRVVLPLAVDLIKNGEVVYSRPYLLGQLDGRTAVQVQ